MSALAADALADLEVGCAGSAALELARGLAGLGARLAADGDPVDLLLVPLDGDSSSLDAVASGALAGALAAGFAAARDAVPRLRPGGCLLLVLATGPGERPAEEDPARSALASLTRTLALEWAPERRVNALVCRHPEDAVELATLAAWRASRTLTGALLDAAPAPARL